MHRVRIQATLARGQIQERCDAELAGRIEAKGFHKLGVSLRNVRFAREQDNRVSVGKA